MLHTVFLSECPAPRKGENAPVRRTKLKITLVFKRIIIVYIHRILNYVLLSYCILNVPQHKAAKKTEFPGLYFIAKPVPFQSQQDSH